ncbi:MAG: hypothetical protein JRE57_00055 [Deltaproteobacteria bacterium]|nr:hypothetical protein [Deltaproteobacteria bacterium]
MSGRERRFDSVPLVVALVGCGKRKAATEESLPASELYTGTPFRMAMRHARATADDVHILSSLHGLTAPHERIVSYDLLMTQLLLSEQSEWGRTVVADLKEAYLLTPLDLVFYAGMQYIRPILQWIGPELGYWTYSNPLEGMDLFARIRWFKKQEGGEGG